ncbi:MAG: BspA family leucine-rich repeat surface protein [Proteobacteria bacterium]|nr:BspA family leucine-rich repeat surface protein [Pseudomonadota bacterium]
MFKGAEVFNQPLCEWDTSKVTSMTFMFYDAYEFNQPLCCWDTSSVTNIRNMFYEAENFNQDLSCWNIDNVSEEKVDNTSFNGFSGSLYHSGIHYADDKANYCKLFSEDSYSQETWLKHIKDLWVYNEETGLIYTCP